MIFDFKKENKELNHPKNSPQIISHMKFLAVEGRGDPNKEEGDYSKVFTSLYAVAYTLKMSCKGNHRIQGFFEYVIPPLEGLWWQEGLQGADLNNKASFSWISVLRIPEFISEKDVDLGGGDRQRQEKNRFQ